MEDNNFVDAENFRGGEETYGFKDIAMRQYQKVVLNSSKEFREGFWVYSQPAPMQNPQRIKYIGDSRRELINSLNALHDILQPKFDDKMKDQSEEIYEEIKETKEDSDKMKDYWKKVSGSYRKMFQQLSFFLDRLGWLASEVYEE